VTGFSRCYGRDIHDDIRERSHGAKGPVYITPEAYRFFMCDDGVSWIPEKFSCKWPECDCPLSSVTGAYHSEKINWLVDQKIKDPSYRIRIRI
jgi:hypothetical protein